MEGDGGGAGTHDKGGRKSLPEVGKQGVGSGTPKVAGSRTNRKNNATFYGILQSKIIRYVKRQEQQK